ncbi:hypothetical protein DL769_002128 [Monosporascus sp. CRB-8-3]|nr:hypothetical protein DL769_002128 [Monosporascus sp. CRB-8-3]
MSALHAVAPELVPKPIAWGKVKDAATETHFLVVEFKDLVPGGVLPDAAKLGSRIAAMHKRSASPNGKFGFHVQTYDGSRIQAVGWDDKWTPFFGRLLAEAYAQDVAANGVWPALEAAFARTQSRLVPRLIGELEAEGRSVTPRLIHGDLWDGNVGVDAATGDPWIFDAAAYYAHHEMELGIWAAERHALSRGPYVREYLDRMGRSEPAGECEDRIRLYSAKTNFMHSAVFPGSPARWS